MTPGLFFFALRWKGPKGGRLQVHKAVTGGWLSKGYFLGRRALITGGSSGIGPAVAGELVRRGAHVFLLARHQDRPEQTVSALKGVAASGYQKIQFAVTDVSVANHATDSPRRAEPQI